MSTNKFDKPYHNMIKFDEKKISDLFMRVNNMNTHDIKQFSLIEQIPLTIVDNEGNNLIHRVLLNSEEKIRTEQQRLSMIQFLYNENVNPNQPNGMNITPLHIACMKQYSTIVHYLLELGVDPNYQDNMGNTPFHKFLAGKIRLEEKEDKLQQGLIIPKQKKIDREYVKKWTFERNKIWREIKTSPYLEALSSTIRDTIRYNNTTGIDTVIQFQNELYNLNMKEEGVVAMDKMKELKTLRDSSLKVFKKEINRKWSEFPSIGDITIHKTETNSWPQNTNATNNLSVVKNADSDIYLKTEMDKRIKGLNETLETVELPENIKVDRIYNEIKDTFEKENPGINYNSTDERLVEFYQKYKEEKAVDFASDIIDWERYSFIGGSRIVRIINELTEGNIYFLLNGCNLGQPLALPTIEKLIYMMAYSLLEPNIVQISGYFDANGNIFNYMIGVGGTPLDDKIIEYIVAIINDNMTSILENDLIQLIQGTDYIYLLDLIEKRTSNKISWLYTFAITFKSKRQFIARAYDLDVDVNQLFIYLIAAFANYKHDMLLSIHQVLKPRLIEDVVYRNAFGIVLPDPIIVAPPNPLPVHDLGAVYGAWIYLLLTSNITYDTVRTNIMINPVLPNIFGHIDTLLDPINLLNIVKYTYNFFNNTLNRIDPNTGVGLFNAIDIAWLNISRDTFIKLSEGEILCCMIIKYYNEMPQKPLLQNIVDTISLIRYRATNSIDNISDTKLNILNRIKTLYEAPFTNPLPLAYPVNRNDAANDLHRMIDIALPNVIANITPQNKFFNIFNKRNDESIEMFLLTEYSLPSKINFYLSSGYNFVDTIPDPNPLPESQYEHEHYLLKKIEASHLGLCFMGILPKINMPKHPDDATLEIVDGTILVNGTEISNGTIIEGVDFPNGIDIINGTILPDGTNFPPGTSLPNGFSITNNAVFPIKQLLLPFQHNGITTIPGEITFQPNTNIPITSNFPEGTYITVNTVITHNSNFPAGTVIPVGTNIPLNVIWQPNAVYPRNRPAWGGLAVQVTINCVTGLDVVGGVPPNTPTITFPPFTNIPPGAIFPSGTFIHNTTRIENGTIFPLGTIIPRTTRIPSQTVWTRNNNPIGGHNGTIPNNQFSIAAVLSKNILPIQIPPGGVATTYGANIQIPLNTIIQPGTTIPMGTNIPVATTLGDIYFPLGNTIEDGTVIPLNSMISPGTILPSGTIFIQGTMFPLETIIEDGCSFPLGTELPNGTIILKGKEIRINKTIVVKRSPKDYMDLDLPEGSYLPVGTVLKSGFMFTDESYLPPGTVFVRGSILQSGTVIQPPSIQQAKDDNSFFSFFHYYNGKNTPTKNKPYFYTNEIDTLFRPPTTFSYSEVLNRYIIKLLTLRNKITSLISRTMKDFKLTSKTSSYASVIGYTYPVLSAISSHDRLIKTMYNENDKFEIYPLKDFEKNVNGINSYIYLYYYLNDNAAIKIPKFIYHQLGEYKQIIFDHNSPIKYPMTRSETGNVIGDVDVDNNLYNSPPNGIDNTGSSPNINVSSYNNVIDGINNGMYYITKNILDNKFIDSKRNKLPPSFESSDALVDFYKLNTIKLITTNPNLPNLFLGIDNSLIREEDLNPSIITTQKFYMGAKMVEELVQLYLKNKVYEIGLSLYNTVIRNQPNLLTDDTERLFSEKYNFDVEINQLPSDNIVHEVFQYRIISQILLNLYPFTKIVDIPSNIFYNYPDDYNGTSLLKSKYRVDINPIILNTMIEKRANLFIHNNETTSPLSQLIKNLHYPSIQALRRELNNTFNYNTYNTLNSPYTYLFEQYSVHTRKFMKNNISSSIRSFVEPQFNEIKNIIQSNDSYNNNIPIDLELSFSICNYLTQHYLSESVFRNTHRISGYSRFMIDGLINPNDGIRSMTDLYYNVMLPQLRIPSANQGTLYDLIVQDLNGKINSCNDRIQEYLNRAGMTADPRILIPLNQKRLDITTRRDNMVQIRDNLLNISQRTLRVVRQPQFNSTPKIIDRYSSLLDSISLPFNKLRGSYTMGWRKLLNLYCDNSPDLITSHVIREELNLIDRSNNIDDLRMYIADIREYYRFLHDKAKNYFESPQFTKSNKNLSFVYDMLVHLTQNILCHSIELIIRKIMFQSAQSIDYLELNVPVVNSTPTNQAFERVNRRIDFILTDEMLNYLYEVVAKKLVMNSVSIYEDIEDKESYESLTTSEILNQFIDLMATNSPIEIHRNTIAILKNSIVPYFDTIVGKTINNWMVCSENMFLFVINQYRLIETIHSSF